jgi:hypothetical protein
LLDCNFPRIPEMGGESKAELFGNVWCFVLHIARQKRGG